MDERHRRKNANDNDGCKVSPEVEADYGRKDVTEEVIWSHLASSELVWPHPASF